MTRPMPTLEMAEAAARSPWFLPAPDLRDWMLETFIEWDARFHNPDHGHLIAARIGVLWTCIENKRNGRRIVGQAEFRPPSGTMGRWQRARAQAQLAEWFDGELDFLLTFDATYAAKASDREFCALVEHELYHCGQDTDEFGAPRFDRSTGLPAFRMRGHDVEEFIGVVKRYGATSPEVAELIEAGCDHPAIDDVGVRAICGSCHA